MGIVYRATDTKLDRTVALKVLPPAALASEDDRARFFREAQAAAKLSHPNVCHVYQVDEAYPAEEGKDPHPDAERRLFIAMEFIDGETLHDMVKKGPLKLSEAVRITTQVADALKAAHGKDIVHRDIKSANVMLTDEGVAKVLDFGLAKTSDSTMLTRLGSTLGTIHYMSPEQARGEDVDSRSDLYSVGTMLYEMIVGRTPFAGEYEQAVIYSILNEDPESVTALRTGVPMQLEWIVNKLLAKDPGRRYQTAADLIADLSGVDTASISQASASGTMHSSAAAPLASASGPTTATTAQSKTRPVWLTPAILIAGLLIGAAGMMLRPGPEPEIKTVKRFELRLPVINENAGGISISPDGSRLAIWDQLETLLLIRDLQTGSTVEHEIPGIFDVKFSDDGQQILISTIGGIQKGRADGSNLISVTNQSGFQAGIWLSGDRIMTSSLGPFVVVVPPIGQPDTVRSETGNVMIPAQELPNGKIFISSLDEDGADEMILLDLDSGAQTRLPGDYDYVFPSGHALSDSRDGKVFVSVVDLESLEPLGPDIPLSYLDDTWVAVAMDGTLVYGEQNQSDNLYEIRVRRRDGRDEQILGEADTEYFRLSPDRHHVLFYKPSESNESITTVLDVRSGLETQIANGTNITEATWNTDGTEIYGFQEDHIVATPSDRSEPPRQLKPVLLGFFGGLEWVSDGSGLVYAGFESTSDFATGIALYHIESDSTEWLVEPDGINAGPMLSKDDRYLSFFTLGDDSDNLPPMTILELETGNTWHLPLEEDATDIRWAELGDALEYLKGDSLMSIPIETDGGFRATGRPQVIEIIPDMMYYYRTVDGDIYYSQEIVDPDEEATDEEDNETVYHVVINWFEELKRIAPTGK